MVVKGIMKRGEYFDSVTLMNIARDVTQLPNISDAAVVMGTQSNKAILEASGLLIAEFKDCQDTDLLICVKTSDDKLAEATLKKAEELLRAVRNRKEKSAEFLPKSLDGALSMLAGANLAIISVAGKYAGLEAMKALKRGLHVMLFSDNVPVETEIELKKFAQSKGLLVMGPDCGTAIINGVPLAFANVVNKGNIGIVAASGTGLQEVSSVISNAGSGISQAIGTGSRDVKTDVGGIMFIEALKALNEDEDTKVIVLVSKPPHANVLQQIAALLKTIHKPVVGIFLGGDPQIVKDAGAIPAKTLEEAGLLAAYLAQGKDKAEIAKTFDKRKLQLKRVAKQEANRKEEGQQFLRGLFSGGTLCYEAQLMLRESLGDVYSNTPLKPQLKLKDSWKSVGHSLIDLGEEEFMVGRPHPMIDFSLRNRKILDEAKDPEVAIILLDVVLGYGSHMSPETELAPVITKAHELASANHKRLSIVCSITGTGQDPQNKEKVQAALKKAGAIVMPSNAAATELCGYILKNLGVTHGN